MAPKRKNSRQQCLRKQRSARQQCLERRKLQYQRAKAEEQSKKPTIIVLYER